MDFNEYILKEKDNMILSLDRLFSINSVYAEPKENAPFGVGAKKALEEVKSIAIEMGLKAVIMYDRVAIIDLYDNNDFPKVGILAHADVVPAGNGWEYEPFKATVDGENIFGRGVIDNKGPIISVLYAMKYIKENLKLKGNFRLIVGSDEECGSSDLEYYKKYEKLPEYIFTPDANYPLINVEKGRATGKFSKQIIGDREKSIIKAYGGSVINAVPDRAYAEFKGFTIDELAKISEKCQNNAKYEFGIDNDIVLLTVYGKSAHASLPEEGENAITALCEFLGLVDERFKCISKACPHGDIYGKALGIDAFDDISGKLTYAFDLVKYENNVFEGEFDIRFPICVTGNSLEDKLHNSFSFYGLNLSEFDSTEPHHTDANSAFVKCLLETYEKVTGEKGEALAVGGGTYAHEIDGAVAFGPEIPGIDNKIHGANEFIGIEHFMMNTRMMYEAIVALDEKL